jgi:hypothetical protein
VFAAVAARPAQVPDHLLLLAAEALHAILTAQPAASSLLVVEAQLHPLVDALALELRQALNTHIDLTLACTLATTLTAAAEHCSVATTPTLSAADESNTTLALPSVQVGEERISLQEIRESWKSVATHLTLTGSMERLSGLCASITDHEAVQLRRTMLPLLKLVVSLARQYVLFLLHLLIREKPQ